MSENSNGYYHLPEPPPHCLARPEALEALKQLILGPEKLSITASEGIFKRSPRLGIHGMGGVGKTVLALMITLDQDIRERFKGEIHWIVLGESRNEVSAQMELAEAVSGEKESFKNVNDGKRRLHELLKERECLVVLDDAWKMSQLSALTGPDRSTRFLVTTRFANLLRSLGAEDYEVPFLEENAARRLLALWSGKNDANLPDAAVDIIEVCGRLPLAVAMVGATLKGKGVDPWRLTLSRLRDAEIDAFDQQIGEYPHANLFSALDVSVKALNADDRERYLGGVQLIWMP